MFWRKNKEGKLGCFWIEETLPYFHNRAATTNKIVYVVDKVIEGNLYQGYQLNAKSFHSFTPVQNTNFLTQDGIEMKFNRAGKIINANKNFSKDGYTYGQKVFIDKLGYLRDIKTVLKVIAVLDDFVIFESIKGYKSMSIYSYKELKRLGVTILQDVAFNKVSSTIL